MDAPFSIDDQRHGEQFPRTVNSPERVDYFAGAAGGAGAFFKQESIEMTRCNRVQAIAA